MLKCFLKRKPNYGRTFSLLLLLALAACNFYNDRCIYADDFGAVLSAADVDTNNEVVINASGDPFWIRTDDENAPYKRVFLVDSGVSVFLDRPLTIKTEGTMELCHQGYQQHDEKKAPVNIFPDASNGQWQFSEAVVEAGRYFGLEPVYGGYSQWAGDDKACTLYGDALDLIYAVAKGEGFHNDDDAGKLSFVRRFNSPNNLGYWADFKQLLRRRFSDFNQLYSRFRDASERSPSPDVSFSVESGSAPVDLQKIRAAFDLMEKDFQEDDGVFDQDGDLKDDYEELKDKFFKSEKLFERFFELFDNIDNIRSDNITGFEGLERADINEFVRYVAFGPLNNKLSNLKKDKDEEVTFRVTGGEDQEFAVYSLMNMDAFLDRYEEFEIFLQLIHALKVVLDQPLQPYQRSEGEYLDHGRPFWGGQENRACWSDQGRGLFVTVGSGGNVPSDDVHRYMDALEARQGDGFETGQNPMSKSFFELYQHHLLGGAGMPGFGYVGRSSGVEYPAKKASDSGRLYFRYRDGVKLFDTLPISNGAAHDLFEQMFYRGWWQKDYSSNLGVKFNEYPGDLLENIKNGLSTDDAEIHDAILDREKSKMNGYHVLLHSWKNCEAKNGQFLKAVILPYDFSESDLEKAINAEDNEIFKSKIRQKLLAGGFDESEIQDYFLQEGEFLFESKSTPRQVRIIYDLMRLGIPEEVALTFFDDNASALMQVGHSSEIQGRLIGLLTGEQNDAVPEQFRNLLNILSRPEAREITETFFERNSEKNRREELVENIRAEAKKAAFEVQAELTGLAEEISQSLIDGNENVIDLDRCAFAIEDSGCYESEIEGNVQSSGVLHINEAEAEGRLVFIMEDSYYPPERIASGLNFISREDKWSSIDSYKEFVTDRLSGIEAQLPEGESLGEIRASYPFATGDGLFATGTSNTGSYRVEVTSKRAGVEITLGDASSSFIVHIIDSIRDLLHGPRLSNGEYAGGLTKDVFNGITKNGEYIAFIRALLVLAVVLYGIAFMAGLSQFSRKEFLMLVAKLAIVGVLISDQSWVFFRDHLFNFFINGIDELINVFTQHFNQVFATIGQPEGLIASAQVDNTVDNSDVNRSGYSNAFAFLDETLMRFLTAEVNYKILALLANFPLGWIYAVLIYIGFFYFIYAVVRAVLVYIVSVFIVAILLMLAPMFIPMMLFGLTRALAQNWLKQLMSFALQPVLLFSVLAIFNVFVFSSIYMLFGYNVCAQCLVELKFSNMTDLLSDLCILRGYAPWGYNPQDPLSERLVVMPVSFMTVLFFYLMCNTLFKFCSWVVKIAASLTIGGARAVSAETGAIDAINEVKKAPGMAKKGVANTLQRARGLVPKEVEKGAKKAAAAAGKKVKRASAKAVIPKSLRKE